MIFETENKQIISRNILSANGAGHSVLADLLAEKGVMLLICGGIGGGARNALAAKGISLVSGAVGNVDAAVQAYLDGTLVDSPAGMC
ncbi:MAG: NifB/NifX family molybdenum-iron cluster-binding protein, partial [Oscillospiraceae bacterium]